jgi:hypothetical protein
MHQGDLDYNSKEVPNATDTDSNPARASLETALEIPHTTHFAPT